MTADVRARGCAAQWLGYSDTAEHALPHAIDFAVIAGTPLHLVRVVDIAHFDPYDIRTPGVLDKDGLPELAAAEAGAERYLGAVRRRCAARGTAASIEVRPGWVIDELVRALRPSDLVVMASRGHDRLERTIVGSVTTALLERSPAPVVVIRVRSR